MCFRYKRCKTPKCCMVWYKRFLIKKHIRIPKTEYSCIYWLTKTLQLSSAWEPSHRVARGHRDEASQILNLYTKQKQAVRFLDTWNFLMYRSFIHTNSIFDVNFKLIVIRYAKETNYITSVKYRISLAIN